MKAVFYFSAIGIKNIAVRTVGQFFLLIVSKRLTWFVVNQKCSGLCVDQRVIPTSTQPPIMSVSIDARRSECASSLYVADSPTTKHLIAAIRWEDGNADASRSLLQLIAVRSSEGSESNSGQLIQPPTPRQKERPE
jgi:hypothetical protein